MDEKIKNFEEAWSKMLDTAAELENEGMKFRYNISVTSSNNLQDKRLEVINAVNSGFMKHGIGFATTNK